jgi:hypothetical protein
MSERAGDEGPPPILREMRQAEVEESYRGNKKRIRNGDRHTGAVENQHKKSMKRKIGITVFSVALAVFATGCAVPLKDILPNHAGLPTPLGDSAAREQHGYIYYLDGAGGGTAKNNWASGVMAGLLAAGYNGAGSMYSWETGKGLLADQDASVKYKRDKAKGLAKKIEQQQKKYPGEPISILSFSAGAASTIYALEDLPLSVQVDHVVMLGCSMSEDYDLTEALKRIKGRMILYTSSKCELVGFWMKLSGTADRKFHDPGAGLKGFILPPDATAATRKLYAEKVVEIPWQKKEEMDGNSGQHFDNVKMPFIRDYVAPILMGKGIPDPPAGSAHAAH